MKRWYTHPSDLAIVVAAIGLVWLFVTVFFLFAVITVC